MQVLTSEEENELITYATKFAKSVARTRYARLEDDLVGASLLGVAIALKHPNLPDNAEGRRRFVGQTSWNLIRQELSRYLKRPQPISFTDMGSEFDPNQIVDPAVSIDEAAWADEFQTLYAALEGQTRKVFDVAFGAENLTHGEVAARVGLDEATVRYHHQKIKRLLKGRYRRDNDDV